MCGELLGYARVSEWNDVRIVRVWDEPCWLDRWHCMFLRRELLERRNNVCWVRSLDKSRRLHCDHRLLFLRRELLRHTERRKRYVFIVRIWGEPRRLYQR